MRLQKLVIGVLVCLAVVLVSVVRALPTPSQFELEGNATVESSADWANTVVGGNTGGALATTFVVDGSGNKTIFTGGGSKDVNDISQWAWKDQLGGLPDKDNITNAYAAAYADAQGALTIYFGADRFATAGDAEMGFWFFHQRVQAIGGKFVGPDGITTANHTLGDVFVLVNFSNGGGTATAQVYKWNGNGVVLVDTVTNALCGQNSDPNVCAVTNSNTVSAPWAYDAKTGEHNQFPPVSFFEGGINISAFINTAGGACFSSFMAETRSSTSLSATQKDFALGEFNTCKLDMTKSCDTVTFDQNTNLLTYTSHIVVTNSGFGPLYDVTVVDTPTAPASPATLTIPLLQKGDSHTFTHTFTYTPSTTTPNPPSNTATASAAVAPGGEQIVKADTKVATCPHVDFDAALSITKACSSALEVNSGKVVVAVNITGTVCNVPPDPNGPFAESINDVSISDNPAFLAGTISLGTLSPSQCKTYTAKYYPSALSVIGGNPSSNPAEQVYTDTAAVSGTGAISGHNRQNTATANCPLCPPVH